MVPGISYLLHTVRDVGLMSCEHDTDGAVYTLGTSTRSFDEFAALLSSHGIQVVADVRRFPSSRFEHFCQPNLARSLAEMGIEYIYMGGELGGYRKGGYRGFTATAEFQEAVAELERVARERETAVVCAERFPWHCHRRFIALELEGRGWQVIHIIDGGKVWRPGQG